MADLSAWLGGALLAGAAGAAFLLSRRELLRSRVRSRLHEPGDDAAEPPATRRRPVSQRIDATPVQAVAAAGVVLAVLALLGWSLPLAAGAGLVVGALTHVAVAAMAKQRSLRLEEGLAEAIGLASSALRAGASPVDALDRAARAIRGPAHPLLVDLAGGLRLGEDVDRALALLVERAPLESYRLFATAVGVQWRAGGSLERSLAVVARAVRDRVELERRIYSQAAPTRASVFAFVAATAAIAGLMWQHDPVNLERFVASSTGTRLVAGALWLQAIGILWMWQMSRIRV